VDISRLRALRELANRQTITAVAQVLCLTPSAVSQQIAQLEEELGLPLTERRGRGVKLTYAGEVLVAHVDRILAVMDEAKSSLAQIHKEIAGTLRIAAFATAAAALMPAVINALRVSFPRLQIILVEMEPHEGLAALNSWVVDLAIVDDLTARLARMEENIEQVDLIDDDLYLVMANNHRLAGRESVTLDELAEEQWALDSATSFYGDFVLDLCRQAGFKPHVNAECRGAEIIEAMVAAGCSISIIPGLRLSQMPSHLRAVRILPAVRRRISAVFRKGEKSHPAIKAVIEELDRISHSVRLTSDHKSATNLGI